MWLGYLVGMALVALGSVWTCESLLQLAMCLVVLHQSISALDTRMSAVALRRLRHYAAPTVDALTLLTVGVTWLTSIAVVALVRSATLCTEQDRARSMARGLAALRWNHVFRSMTQLADCAQVPIDVYSSLAQKAESKVYIAELWSFSYWSTQVLTWLLIPLLQGYVDSGAFTVAARYGRASRASVTMPRTSPGPMHIRTQRCRCGPLLQCELAGCGRASGSTSTSTSSSVWLA